MATANENTAPEAAMTIAEKRLRYQTLTALMRTLTDSGELTAVTAERAQQIAATICGFERSSIFIN